MKKILVAFGTRPEAIKLSPLILALKREKDFSTLVCHSGQHDTLCDDVLSFFGIKEDRNLRICEKASDIATLTSEAVLGYSALISENSFDAIIVHGDTLTAFSATLSAFYSHIPVFHVEAGLRSYDMYSPFPEEWNRVAIDLLSTLCFAPTQEAKENLLAIKKSEKGISVVGNTVTDALTYTVKEDYKSPLFDKEKRLIVFTAHRRENIGAPIENACLALKRIVSEFPDVKVISPMHPNPLVREIIAPILSENERIILTEPMSVYDFHNILSRTYLVLSDSGGIQEEASTLCVPMLICREKTERQEGCKKGIIKLTGISEDKIYENMKNLLKNREEHEKMRESSFSYGDGRVSERIVREIKKFFDKK